MIVALLGALLVGLSLGLLGSGGSILTVPVLVYLLHHEDKIAIAESLAIVGSIALVGAIMNARRRTIDPRSVAFFGVPGMAGAYAGSQLSANISGELLLLIFAVFMLVAAVMMIRRRSDELIVRPRSGLWAIVLNGLIVGFLTGLVGIGGGFIIVPALVLLCRLPMRLAIGTSLAIIALNGLSGFIVHLHELNQRGLHVDWPTIGLFIAVGSAGSLAGHLIGSRLDPQLLRRIFGVFLFVMAAFIMWQQAMKIF